MASETFGMNRKFFVSRMSKWRGTFWEVLGGIHVRCSTHLHFRVRVHVVLLYLSIVCLALSSLSPFEEDIINYFNDLAKLLSTPVS